MYLKMFGFDEKPFHITPNPRFIFLSKIHKEAFAHLLYGIQQRVGFLSLSGEIGTGKTTVLRTLLGQLEEAEYRVALIFNPCLSALELLQTIHREFTIEFDQERAQLVELHDSLNRFLLQQREAGKTVVLVVDEAQNLDPKVLEQLRLLSNLETETEKLIQMILVGQPELDEILQRSDLRQLRQRLAVRYQLRAMDAEDTESYVKHRARVAGSQDSSLFESKALTQIYRYTQGTPRLINILCDRALLVAYGRDSKTVSRLDVHAAQKELQRQDSKRMSRFVPLMGSLLLGVIVVILVGVKIFSLASPPADITAEMSQSSAEQQIQKPVQQATIQVQEEVAEPVSAERIKILRQAIAEYSVEESGLQSVVAMAELWQRPVPTKLPVIDSRRKMQSALMHVGFDLVEIQGRVPELLKADAPLVLEIILPNIVGKRFLTVTRYRDGQLQTVPMLTDSGWLSQAELEAVWFGKALLPYLNYEKIPLIDRPNVSGQKIIALQNLLAGLDDANSVQSGRYDAQTVDIVTRFQQQQNLAPDGRVGAHTLYWLYRETGHDMPRLRVGEGS